MAILVLLGLGIGSVLRRSVPVGRDLGANETVKSLLNDRVSPSRSSPEPTLTLVVFTDYQCPACKLADPAMAAAIVEDGHIRVVYKDWPIFGAPSERAARVAIAADRQGIYPRLHSCLMSERRRLDDTILRECVKRSGGDWLKVQSDLQAHAFEIERQLSSTRRAAFGLGFPGTPAFLAGTVVALGALNQSEFERLFAQGRQAAIHE
ncbi:DsbA family protein [Sphingomonas sp. GB1N7]|uniref:DsbA family protein n=1 Tax=Parasphingomonas caseinilytica TaxID=3096158 RepID=UPI002FC5C609